MGWVTLFALCINCKMAFSCNPNLVPSLKINGVREPLCRNCAERWNQLHPEKAREIPVGAYEPVKESDVIW